MVFAPLPLGGPSEGKDKTNSLRGLSARAEACFGYHRQLTPPRGKGIYLISFVHFVVDFCGVRIRCQRQTEVCRTCGKKEKFDNAIFDA
jgi:hypothetical protein